MGLSHGGWWRSSVCIVYCPASWLYISTDNAIEEIRNWATGVMFKYKDCLFCCKDTDYQNKMVMKPSDHYDGDSYIPVRQHLYIEMAS